jgi:multidrug efflux pump subunit AcrA (membrane-fusion protein)
VALLKARFDVRRAELEVSKNELVSQIDAKKNLLALEEAKRALAQLEEDVKSRAASGQATIAVNEEKRAKALLAMKQAQKNIEDMRVRAPIDGLVAVKENREASGGFFYTGMVLPEYREGDQLWPGSFVAEILGVERMEIQAKVTEGDRANLNPGQGAEVQVYSVPGQKFTARVKTVAGLASRGWWWGDSASRTFDASFTLDRADPRLRPGLTAQIVILSDPMKNVLLLPRQALFEKDGKPVAYVKTGSSFEAREVRITRRTESRVAIEGLKEGTEVALVNPEQGAKGASKPAALALPGAPGGGR